jgi:hypothetical protein
MLLFHGVLSTTSLSYRNPASAWTYRNSRHSHEYDKRDILYCDFTATIWKYDVLKISSVTKLLLRS